MPALNTLVLVPSPVQTWAASFDMASTMHLDVLTTTCKATTSSWGHTMKLRVGTWGPNRWVAWIYQHVLSSAQIHFQLAWCAPP